MDRFWSTICKISGRSSSVYKDTSASHEYLCKLIKNGHEICKLLLKRTQIVVCNYGGFLQEKKKWQQDLR